MTMRTNHIIGAALLAASLFACGGSSKSSGLAKGGGVPPPPPNIGGGGNATEGGAPVEKREISTDARKDYESAMSYFAQNEKGSWNESACRGAADKFQSVARS